MNMEATYPIIPLVADAVLAPEEMGSKRKGWVQVPNDQERWLFKYARLSAGAVTGEHWAEKIAAELAALLEIPHARVELATLEGEPGSISRRFAELAQPGTELVHGNDLLAGLETGYVREKYRGQSDHTLDNILTAVGKVISEKAAQHAALTQLAGYLVLDALILNTDRHHENWALLRTIESNGQVTHRVAPTFDHASSLGRNEPPEKLSNWLLEDWRPHWYVERAAGAIYVKPDDKSGENPLQLAKIAYRRWPEYFREWIERLRATNFRDIESTVVRLPKAMMVKSQQQFALKLLHITFNELCSMRR